MTRPRFLEIRTFPGMISPWQLQTYRAVDTAPTLRSPWREVMMEGYFQGVLKKTTKTNPPLTGKINPDCLNGLVCPQTGCVISPQECIIPFLPSELSQDWKSESFLPVCPRSWGEGGGCWFPFHLLWSAGLDLRWPWEGTQTLILAKVANTFSRNNGFQ